MSTMNTSVLISSIFFMADSLVTGQRMIRYLSKVGILATDRFGALGSRGLMSVFGRKKCTFLRTFRVLRETDVFSAFETLPALPDLAFSPPSAAAFLGAIALRLSLVALH